MQMARVILEVTAGILPGTPEPQLTRQYALTSDEWQSTPTEDHGRLLAERNAAAQGYAAWLMMQPDRVNWVRLDWLWL